MSSLFGIGGGGNVGAAGGTFYDYEIENSVRMSDASNSQIYWQAGTPSSGNIWTVSFWFKKYSIGAGQAANEMFGAGSSGAAYMFWSWDNSEKFTFQSTADGNKGATTGSPQFRDVGAWYHMVIRADTTQGTQADRLRVYLNGEQITTWGTDSIGTSTWDYINASGFNQYWGGASGIANGNPGCNHYLADINFCDGQSYDASYFGEFKNGIWVPINPSVTYGNNGYRLEFKQTGTGGASSTTVGADTSGNSNHFTDSGISADDVVPDSPTNNFATINVLDPTITTSAISEANLKITEVANNLGGKATFAVPATGKWYWEAYCNCDSAQEMWNGITGITTNSSGDGRGGSTNSNTYGASWSNYSGSDFFIRKYIAGVESAESGSFGTTANTVLGIAIDRDANEAKFYKDNALQFTTSISSTQEYFPAGGMGGGTNATTIQVWNFGQDSTFAGATTAGGNADDNGIGDFKYAPPSGFLALCSANLPEVTIGPNSTEQADDYFTSYLYTADGTSPKSRTGIGFTPDFLWFKDRTTAFSHALYDTVRGTNKGLQTNSTSAENSYTLLTSFDADGFTTSNDGTAGNLLNYSTDAYVTWAWKAGGTAVSNTDGSITSQVSAAPDAGFSIVSYTGTGANATVGHGLSSAPDMIIAKGRSTAGRSWAVYHSEIASDAETDYLLLNSTAAAADNNIYWNDTAPTSSVFSVGTASNTNQSSVTFIAYCFHSVDGYSKVGSYVGNANADGTFVYTGFRPAFVLLKKSSAAGDNWSMYDNKRDTDNTVREYLIPNQSAAAASTDTMDFVSNGFKVRNSGAYINTSGATYIYLAFAEAPFKYANAR